MCSVPAQALETCLLPAWWRLAWLCLICLRWEIGDGWEECARAESSAVRSLLVCPLPRFNNAPRRPARTMHACHDSQYGCLVVNAPTANTVAAAEHGIALLCAMARNVSQVSTTCGPWFEECCSCCGCAGPCCHMSLSRAHDVGKGI